MHVRCPHCRNPIEVVEEQSLAEVSCPTCGSSFNLIGGQETTAYAPGETRTIAHFELIEQIGVGHFGTVWKARDTELDRIVAIKIPRKDELTEAEVEQFLREARAAAQFKHPNIVPVHEVGRDGDTVYIVSDYVAGATLKEWLRAQQPTPREAAELCAKIADALHDAHVAGVIHRDVKPGNIMMDMDGEPHIMDFGLAKRESGEITMTVEGHILGTPAYMSPEQARGEGHRADRRSDVYSLGVILYELLTGELPFRGETRMLVVQILRDEPPSPRKLNSRLPRDLETICLKCLEKAPERRYQSAHDVTEDLRRHLEGRPITARPIGRIERGCRWARRHPARAGLLAATAIALVTLVGLSVGFVYQQRLTGINSQLKKVNESLDERNSQLKQERANVERLLYLRHVALALSEWKDNEVARAKASLGKCPAKLRHWEWYYVYGLCHSDLLTFDGHTLGVHSVSFSPDGEHLASAGYDGVKVWDAQSGQEVVTMKADTSTSTSSVAFSPDGKRLAGAGSQVTVWDADSGEERLTLKGYGSVFGGVAFSPDGKWLASAGLQATVVWDAKTGKELHALPMFRGTSVAFSPDGKRLASTHDSSVILWDVESGRRLFAGAFDVDACTVAFSPDGKRLAAGSVNGTVKLWDTESGTEVKTLKGHTLGVSGVAFSPDGKRLASAGADRLVKCWDVESGEETLTLKGHTDQVTSVAFSPDGKRLASAGLDKSVKVWESQRDQEVLTLGGHNDNVFCVAFSPDGKQLASTSFKTIKVWNIQNGQEVSTLSGHTGHVMCVAFSPDGKRLASGGDAFDVKRLEQKKGIGELKVWDVAHRKAIALKGHTEAVKAVAFSPDGKWLASGSHGTVRVWDVTNGQEEFTLRGPVNRRCLAFSPDGKRLASAGWQKAKVWDTEKRQEICTLEVSTGWVDSVAFFPNGNGLIFSAENTLKAWDAQRGLETLDLGGYGDLIMGVAPCPDNKRLAVAGGESLKVWDAKNGTETLNLKARSSFIWPAFSPNGKWLAAIDSKTVKVWTAAGDWDGKPPINFPVDVGEP